MPCRVKNDFSLQFDIEVVYLSRGLNHAPVPETDVWMGQAGIYPGLPSYYLNSTHWAIGWTIRKIEEF